MSASECSRLTSTLILALTQNEALQRQFEDSARTIERLKRDNEKLRQQLAELRQEPPLNDRPDLAAQLDHLFRKDAEKQAEIDRLRKRLAHATNTQAQTPYASSPATVSGDEQASSNGSRKRVKVNSRGRGPLKEIPANSSPGECPQQPRKPKLVFSDRGGEAIPYIAEDGVDYSNEDSEVAREEPAEHNSSLDAPTVNNRLQVLLSMAAVDPKPLITTIPRPMSARKAPVTAGRGPEDDEPLRSRPLHRLNLAHFKVNPKHAGGLNFAFQEVVRNKDARKCLPSCTKPECCGASFKALAKTLPNDPNMTEDQLLLEFLGQGSEEKISGLTPLARTNLLHEAKAKRLANAYGKMHRANFEAPSSPPDFWCVDIPATQEHKDNREQGKLKEREEVERRFHEATSGGRWLFADE